jgi:isoleucyl-tRNA synthetase
MPLVKEALGAADPAELRRALDERGEHVLALGDGTTITIGPGDVEVRPRAHEELALAQGNGDAVALDTTLDDELRAEGIARELIRVVNDARRRVGLEIADRIRVELWCTGRIEAAAHAHRDWIGREVLAVDLVLTADGPPAAVDVFPVEGEAVGLAIERV